MTIDTFLAQLWAMVSPLISWMGTTLQGLWVDSPMPLLIGVIGGILLVTVLRGVLIVVAVAALLFIAARMYGVPIPGMA